MVTALDAVASLSRHILQLHTSLRVRRFHVAEGRITLVGCGTSPVATAGSAGDVASLFEEAIEEGFASRQIGRDHSDGFFNTIEILAFVFSYKAAQNLLIPNIEICISICYVSIVLDTLSSVKHTSSN